MRICKKCLFNSYEIMYVISLRWREMPGGAITRCANLLTCWMLKDPGPWSAKPFHINQLRQYLTISLSIQACWAVLKLSFRLYLWRPAAFKPCLTGCDLSEAVTQTVTLFMSSPLHYLMSSKRSFKKLMCLKESEKRASILVSSLGLHIKFSFPTNATCWNGRFGHFHCSSWKAEVTVCLYLMQLCFIYRLSNTPPLFTNNLCVIQHDGVKILISK